MEPICPVDASGCFLKPVVDFEGQYVKDADKNIIAILKANGRLIHQSQVSTIFFLCLFFLIRLFFRLNTLIHIVGVQIHH